jgi:hypothetical protein
MMGAARCALIALHIFWWGSGIENESDWRSKMGMLSEGFVTLLNRARNNSAGMSGSRRGDDCVPCLHRRCPEGSVRPC